MAPSRGKGKAKVGAHGSSRASQRASRTTRIPNDGVPEVYQDMLSEAADHLAFREPERPLKRRRVAGANTSTHSQHEAVGEEATRSTARAARSIHVASLPRVQTIEQSSDDDSDLAFEDVDLDPAVMTPSEHNSDDDTDQGIADVSISLHQQTTPARHQHSHRRKPASAAVKAFRLLVHKAHVLCLLAHCMFVNSWCNNSAVQKHIRPILSKRTVDWFHDQSDFQAARHLTFLEALQKCRDDLGQHFEVTVSGMCAPRWMNDEEPVNISSQAEPMDLADFISAAKKRKGSQDVGNQLFCALLRSIGINARLICSLQPLPFTSASSKGLTPQRATATIADARTPHPDHVTHQSVNEDHGVRGSKSIGTVPSARRRLGQPSFDADLPSPTPVIVKSKTVRKLSYPVWWVEAFDEAYQKWIPIDPLVTKTVDKASKLEPPSSYRELNHLTYVVALEDDGVARDVTRRYTKAYNAKTRRQRVESTENGTQWMKKAMRVFRRRGRPLDRDQVEDAELAQKEAKEGLPANVQDFKDHPYYALERHLKRHEVLHPRREVGKVNAGTAAKPRLEAVFRRQDVVLCRSGDKWFRLGREIKAGEQPLKHVTTQRRPRASRRADDIEGDEHEGKTTALYSFTQTTLYIPPSVIRGRVPRNAFGNLDIYVPSMVPAGGVHIRHALTRQAASLLHVHSVDAVTGFQFKGRQGTAVIEGAVVPSPYAEAVKAVVESMEWSQVEDASRTRSLTALKMWKRFLTSLKIRQRVDGLVEKEHVRAVTHPEEGDIETSDVVAVADDYPLLTAGRHSLYEVNEATKRPDTVKVGKRDGEADALTEADATPEPDMPSDLDASEDHDLRDFGGGFVRSDAAADAGRSAVEISSKDVNEDLLRGHYLIPEDDEDDTKDLGNTRLGLNDDDPEGGGFVPDGDFGGGGFVVSEESHGNADDGVESPLAAAPDKHHNDKEDQSLRDHATHVRPEESSKLTLSGPKTRPPVAPCRHEIRQPPENEFKQARHMSEPQSATSPVGQDTGMAEESDRGSLLSHDPEDEDAEPDWLDSD